MPCFQPLPAARVTLADGSQKVVVYPKAEAKTVAGYEDPLQVPCGRCIGCRLERSKQWAIRMMHEQQIQQEKGRPSCFITLTYDDDHVPTDGSLVKPHWQNFIKKLRRNFEQKISYYHCGEYGDQLGRPHYHAAIFGTDFDDKVIWKHSNENPLYTSDTLSDIWGKGFVTVGDLTFESAAYMARYVLKKQFGNTDHYKLHPVTGLTHEVQPEYNTMSLKPAIGKDWYEKYKDDVFPWDEVIVNGHPNRPPRYYRQQYEITNPDEYDEIKKKNLLYAESKAHDNTPARLHDRQKVKQAQVKFLKRTLDNGH